MTDDGVSAPTVPSKRRSPGRAALVVAIISCVLAMAASAVAVVSLIRLNASNDRWDRRAVLEDLVVSGLHDGLSKVRQDMGDVEGALDAIEDIERYLNDFARDPTLDLEGLLADYIDDLASCINDYMDAMYEGTRYYYC